LSPSESGGAARAGGVAAQTQRHRTGVRRGGRTAPGDGGDEDDEDDEDDLRVSIPPDFRQYLSLRGASVTGEQQQAEHRPLTLRALFVGSFLSLFLAVGANYADIVTKGSYMTLDFSAPGAIFVFLVLVGGLNTLFKLVARRLWLAGGSAGAVALAYLAHYYPYAAMHLYEPAVLLGGFMVVALAANAVLATRNRSLALNRSELIVVYIMLLVVASLTTMGLCETLLPAITGVFYYASPENEWAELLIPHLPTPLMLNDGSANTNFYEGVGTTGFAIPYQIWLRPMAVWGVFLLALYMAMVSAAVILRRQWMDRERLAYPLMQTAQAIIRVDDEGRALNPFFRNKAMWAGAAIPIVFGLFTGLGKYVNGFPAFPTAWSFPVFGGQSINMTLSFAVLGFSYLISPDIAAGIWGFALLAKLERAVFVTEGVVKRQEVWAVAGSELLNYQGLGALIVFVLLGLWVGREHLRDVVRKFLGQDSQLSDDDEIMPYRAAVLGLLVGVAVMVGWFVVLGVPWWAGALFVGLAMLIFTGITRIVAESGIPALISPMVAPDFMIFGVGSNLLGAKAISTFTMSYVFATDIRVFLMGMVGNGLKLIEGMSPRSRRYVFWAIFVAVLLGLTGSLWTIMQLAYKDGGINSSGWFFKDMPQYMYRTAVQTLKPAGVYWSGMGFLGAGAVSMLLLTWLRQRFLWWPLHPIGFPIMASWLVDWMWFSVFFAWLVKITILKYGGASLFTRSRTFFLGIIVGRMLITGGWLVVDYLTGKVGNAIFWI
jgi:hypothetical protein